MHSNIFSRNMLFFLYSYSYRFYLKITSIFLLLGLHLQEMKRKKKCRKDGPQVFERNTGNTGNQKLTLTLYRSKYLLDILE
jgi:hypothetical protein